MTCDAHPYSPTSLRRLNESLSSTNPCITWSYITGCLSYKPLTVTVNMTAECLRRDRNGLGDKKNPCITTRLCRDGDETALLPRVFVSCKVTQADEAGF